MWSLSLFWRQRLHWGDCRLIGSNRTLCRVQLSVLPLGSFIISATSPRLTTWRLCPSPSVTFNGVCRVWRLVNRSLLLHIWHVAPESRIHWSLVILSTDNACCTIRPALSFSELLSSWATIVTLTAPVFTFLSGTDLAWPLNFAYSSLFYPCVLLTVSPDMPKFVAKVTPRFLPKPRHQCSFLIITTWPTLHLRFLMQQPLRYHSQFRNFTTGFQRS